MKVINNNNNNSDDSSTTTATTTTTTTSTNTSTTMMMNKKDEQPQEHKSVRVVRFSNSVIAIKSLHINNYTDEEVFDTWYTPKEYNQMKREIKLTVAMMDKKSKFAEGINFSSRGLEDKTADQIIQKVEHRLFALDAVLEEQDRQHQLGICDPIAISHVYIEYSFISHMAAFLVAANDEKLALGYSTTSSSTAAADDDQQQESSKQKKKQQQQKKKSTGNKKSSTSASTINKKMVPEVVQFHVSRVTC